MNAPNENQERQLRELLGTTGRNAEQRAPSFQRVWAAARRAQAGNARPLNWSRPRWTLATVLLALLIAGGWHWGRSRPDVSRVADGQRGRPLAADDWESESGAQLPTDFLLAANRAAEPVSVAQLAAEINELLRP